MTDTQTLKNVVNKSGLKKIYIADKLGLSRNGLALKMNGKTEFTAAEIQMLADILRLTAKDVQRIFFAKNVTKNATL